MLMLICFLGVVGETDEHLNNHSWLGSGYPNRFNFCLSAYYDVVIRYDLINADGFLDDRFPRTLSRSS